MRVLPRKSASVDRCKGRRAHPIPPSNEQQHHDDRDTRRNPPEPLVAALLVLLVLLPVLLSRSGRTAPSLPPLPALLILRVLLVAAKALLVRPLAIRRGRRAVALVSSCVVVRVIVLLRAVVLVRAFALRSEVGEFEGNGLGLEPTHTRAHRPDPLAFPYITFLLSR